MIQTILTVLFCVDTQQYRATSQKGIFRHLSAYFGVVESQGHGTLHLHILLWLQNAPSLPEMHYLLKTEYFHLKVVQFLKANIHTCIPGLDSLAAIRAVSNDMYVTYSCSPNSSNDNQSYNTECAEYEHHMVHVKQVYICELCQCLQVNQKGTLTCKHRAPFEICNEAYVLETGVWCSKWCYAYINAWNPMVSICGRCNNDLKLLLNGPETINILYYITGYLHRNQQKNHNILSVVACTLVYHSKHSDYL